MELSELLRPVALFQGLVPRTPRGELTGKEPGAHAEQLLYGNQHWLIKNGIPFIINLICTNINIYIIYVYIIYLCIYTGKPGYL